MRLMAGQRRWCPCSGIVFVCLFLAMTVFIAFEVLDLDGSNLQNPLASTAIAAEPAPTAVEKLLPPSHAIPAAQSRVTVCLDPRLTPEAGKHPCHVDGNSLIARLVQAHPQSFARRETTQPAPLSDEPA
jgi:hypothetical protein